MSEKINRRERKKMHSKKMIIEAAVRMFEEKGYQETTVADIMNAADLGIGTFYNYFESKEEIPKHLLAQMISETNQYFQSLLAEKRTAAEMLTEMFLSIARLLDGNRFVLPLFLSAAYKGTLPKERVESAGGLTFKHIFDQMIAAGQENGEFRRDIPAQIITEMFHSVFQAASFSSVPISFMENIRYKLTLILDGISHPPRGRELPKE